MLYRALGLQTIRKEYFETQKTPLSVINNFSVRRHQMLPDEREL